MSHHCSLILIGGFVGTGKSTISRQLAAELHIPRLGSDTIGWAIKTSDGIKNGDAYWVAYDVL
jgi:2-phosphoglycerate kinase